MNYTKWMQDKFLMNLIYLNTNQWKTIILIKIIIIVKLEVKVNMIQNLWKNNFTKILLILIKI